MNKKTDKSDLGVRKSHPDIQRGLESNDQNLVKGYQKGKTIRVNV